MKNKMMKSFLTILFGILVSSSFTFAQNMSSDSMKMDHEHMNGMNMKHDSTYSMEMHHKHMKDMHMNDSSHKMKMDSSIVREGVIDLQAIDKNNDGKVFQDMMDWNVISDNPGKCPLCGMKLKEVTLEKAKENLLKNGYKVK